MKSSFQIERYQEKHNQKAAVHNVLYQGHFLFPPPPLSYTYMRMHMNTNTHTYLFYCFSTIPNTLHLLIFNTISLNTTTNHSTCTTNILCYKILHSRCQVLNKCCIQDILEVPQFSHATIKNI